MSAADWAQTSQQAMATLATSMLPCKHLCNILGVPRGHLHLVKLGTVAWPRQQQPVDNSCQNDRIANIAFSLKLNRITLRVRRCINT
jgi:hypothetical protein